MAFTTNAAALSAMQVGRTPLQKKVIKYFVSGGGCLSGVMKDAEYDNLIYNKLQSTNFKQLALNKIGLDEAQISEIPPIQFAAFHYDDNTMFKLGKDLKMRSSAYQVTWIFFSSEQMYVYQHTFNMANNTKQEETYEYFYKDITAFYTATDTRERLKAGSGCLGWLTGAHYETVDFEEFVFAVPNNRFACSVTKNDYTIRAIHGMKAKLREKKAL